MWLARDKDGTLCLYENKPNKCTDFFLNTPGNLFCVGNNVVDVNYHDGYIELNDSYFPKVTFENSPQEVEIKIVNR